MTDYTNSRAVLIGVSCYKDTNVSNVPSAAKSLQKLRALLIDPDLCGWPEDRVTVIENPPTASRLAQQLRKLAEETTATLLVYFVGHGALSDRGELCLVVGETEIADPDPDLTGLEFRHVRDAVLRSPAKSKIVILDCCYSGKVIPDLSVDDTRFANFTEISGAYTLTALDRQARTPPAEEIERCTLFTEALIDIVRKGLPSAPEFLTFSAIYQELLQQVRAAELPRPNQRGTNTILDYPFSRNVAFGPVLDGELIFVPDIDGEPDPPPGIVESPSRTPRVLVVGAAVLVGLVIVIAIVWAPWRKQHESNVSPVESLVPTTSAPTSATTVTTPGPGSSASKAPTSARVIPAAAPRNLSTVYASGQAKVSWNAPDLAGGQLVHYLVSGTGLGDKTVTTTDTTYTDLPGGATITFTVRAITKTAEGQRLTGAPAVKDLTILASPKITISRGADTSSSRCEKPNCSWINAQLTGFQPNTTYKVYPFANGHVFSEPCVATTDSNGSATCNDVRYDVPDTNVYEYIETPTGVIKSNILYWEPR